MRSYRYKTIVVSKFAQQSTQRSNVTWRLQFENCVYITFQWFHSVVANDMTKISNFILPKLTLTQFQFNIFNSNHVKQELYMNQMFFKRCKLQNRQSNKSLQLVFLYQPSDDSQERNWSISDAIKHSAILELAIRN